ncbi:MAG: hypothetical protein HXX13_03195 [Bacteroidetes bacterium]|nr:hypothetical protein [Bacteroidota bacterium]
MKPLMDCIGKPLFWKQPHLMESLFELKEREEVFGILRFKNGFGSRAFGTTAEGEWSFKRQGFVHTYVTIRKSGEEKNYAIFRNNTWSGGGTLELADGRQYQANSNYWHALFEFKNERNVPLMRFTNIGGFKLHAQLEIFKSSSNLVEAPMLALLGWYLAVMISRDGEMVAGVF